MLVLSWCSNGHRRSVNESEHPGASFRISPRNRSQAAATLGHRVNLCSRVSTSGHDVHVSVGVRPMRSSSSPCDKFPLASRYNTDRCPDASFLESMFLHSFFQLIPGVWDTFASGRRPTSKPRRYREDGASWKPGAYASCCSTILSHA